jgi:hypothetical protein
MTPRRRAPSDGSSQWLPSSDPGTLLVEELHVALPQAPAQEHAPPLALGREIDEPRLGVAQQDPALGEVDDFLAQPPLRREPRAALDAAAVRRERGGDALACGNQVAASGAQPRQAPAKLRELGVRLLACEGSLADR